MLHSDATECLKIFRRNGIDAARRCNGRAPTWRRALLAGRGRLTWMTGAGVALSGQEQVKEGGSRYRVVIRVSTLGHMASTREKFAAFLRAAMDAAGVRPQDVETATGGDVRMSTIYRWLRAEGDDGVELSWKRLRAVGDVLNVPPLDMAVAAGLLSAEEAGYARNPPPPVRRSIEDEIRVDPRFSPRRREALIALIEELSEEESPRTPVRPSRTRVSPDQGIDTGDNEELSG